MRQLREDPVALLRFCHAGSACLCPVPAFLRGCVCLLCFGSPPFVGAVLVFLFLGFLVCWLSPAWTRRPRLPFMLVFFGPRG